MKALMDTLNDIGMTRDCPIEKQIKEIGEDDLDKPDYAHTSLLLFLARQSIEQKNQHHKDQQEMSSQIKNLTHNVQTLTATLKDLENRENKPKPKTFAEVAKPGDTPVPTTPNPKGKRKSEEGPTPPKNTKNKQSKPEGQTGKAVPATEEKPKPTGKENEKPPTPAILTARRRLFATRTVIAPVPEAKKLEPNVSIAIAKRLRECGCTAPVNLQVQFNQNNGTLSLTTAQGTGAAEYTKFLTPITEAVNGCLPDEEPKYNTFRRAPTDCQVVIHGVALMAITNDQESMAKVMSDTLEATHKIKVNGARFLQKSAEVRASKLGTSIVLSVPAEDAPKITPTILLHGRYRTSAVMWQATPATQCRKCYKYGHPEEGCKEQKQKCPICSENHNFKEHKCKSTTCPKKGHKKIIPNCCPITPAKCPACDGPHSALDSQCPAKIAAKAKATQIFDRKRQSSGAGEMDTTGN
jgi:hypothetical protein